MTAAAQVKGEAPRYVQALRRIGESKLAPIDKHLMCAALEWWNDKRNDFWPAVGKLASRMGKGTRQVQTQLDGLRAAGILIPMNGTTAGGKPVGGRGKSTRYTIDWRKLQQFERAPTPRRKGCSPLRPLPLKRVQSSATKGAVQRQERVQPTAPEPSIEPPKNHPCGNGLQSAKMDGCPAARPRSTRDALAAAGVRGPNLETLVAQPGLTAKAVDDLATELRADGSVRLVPAVLVRRLSERLGIDLDRGTRRRGTGIAPDLQRALERQQRTRSTE